MLLRKFYIVTLILLITSLSTACGRAYGNSAQKSSEKNASTIINNSDQRIPANWHKIETDKFSISFPKEWTADVKNGIVSFYNKSLEVGLVGALPIIPQSPNTVYLHGKYHVTAEEKNWRTFYTRGISI